MLLSPLISPCVRTGSRRDLGLPQCERLIWPRFCSWKVMLFVLRIHHKDMFSFLSKSINFTKKHTEMTKVIVQLGIVIATHISNLCWAQSYYSFFMRLLVNFRKRKPPVYLPEKGIYCPAECCHLTAGVERKRLWGQPGNIGTWMKSVSFSGWWRT